MGGDDQAARSLARGGPDNDEILADLGDTGVALDHDVETKSSGEHVWVGTEQVCR